MSAQAVDIYHMARFMTWAIRVPAFFAGALCLAAGATAVVDWSLAFTGAALFGFLVEAGGHLGAKSGKSTPETVDLEQPVDEFAVLQFRIADLEEDEAVDEAA